MDLKHTDLPKRPDLSTLSRFAYSFKAYEEYGSFEAVGDLANKVSHKFSQSGKLPSDLRELRACLFFESRRERFVWLDIAKHHQYMWTLVDQLRDVYLEANK